MAHFVFYDTPQEVAQKAARLRYRVSGERMAHALARTARLAAKYSPDQPRVPAGNRDGGQWTNEGDSLVRIAANGPVRLKPESGAIPADAVKYFVPDGKSFFAPPNADFQQAYEYGQSLRGQSPAEMKEPS